MKHLSLILLLFLTNKCVSQSRWHPFVGVHASMDGGGYYVGPSFQIGTDYSLKNRNSLVAYLHYFSKKLDNTWSDGSFEHGKYKSAAATILFQVQLSNKEKRGMLLAAGAALQKTSENYKSDIEEIHSKRVILVAALRIAHLFPISSKTLSVELNALGPHKRTEGTEPYITEITEVLTQLSLGARLIF